MEDIEGKISLIYTFCSYHLPSDLPRKYICLIFLREGDENF
jgi:hypothetical protein